MRRGAPSPKAGNKELAEVEFSALILYHKAKMIKARYEMSFARKAVRRMVQLKRSKNWVTRYKAIQFYGPRLLRMHINLNTKLEAHARRHRR